MKKKNKFFSVIVIILIIYLGFTICDVFGIKSKKTAEVDIPKGASLSTVTDVLNKNDIIKNELVFKLFARSSFADFKYGIHNLSSNMTYFEIIEELSKSGNENGISVTIPEGYETYKIAEELKNKGLIKDADAFLEHLDNMSFDYKFLKDIKRTKNKYEGYLYPAVYTFKAGITEEEIVKQMLDAFNNYFKEEYYERAKEMNLTVDEVITMASIIQRESGGFSEDKKVSGVFYNRIKEEMPLQSCATIQYVLKERKSVLSVEDTKIDTPYNTYINKGLPIGPIASPGNNAIEAALYPEKHDYLYFVVKPEGGGHTFSKTFEEHQEAMKKAGL